MRILFLTNYYPPYEVGGYEQLCRDVAVRLAERGHVITVLTSDHGVDRHQEVFEPGIHRLLRIQPRYGARLSPAVQFFLTRRRNEAHNRRVFRQVAERFSPDVVFIWNLEGLPYELAIDAESSQGIAVAYWLAHYSPAEPDSFWRYWMRSPGKRAFLRGPKSLLRSVAVAQMRNEGKPVQPRMHHVGVVSEYMRQKGLAAKTLPPHTKVIYNGVEVATYRRPVPPPDTPPPIRLLLAGRVSPDKGIHIAIEAVRQLARTSPQRDFHLIVAGSGPQDYLAELHNSVATDDMHALVSFTGWLPRRQMPDLMHQCHLLLLTAVFPEAFSRVVLEGMAAGLAVVGTLTGGTGELLEHGINSLTCTADDSSDLARQIARLLDDPQLRCRLACRGQEIVLKQYTLERMVDRVEDLLERALVEENA